MKMKEWLNEWVSNTADNDMVTIRCGCYSVRCPYNSALKKIRGTVLNWNVVKVVKTYSKPNRRWSICLYANITPNRAKILLDSGILK